MKVPRSSEVGEARVELVPLIDCVFLLLIFFMCAASLTTVDTSGEVRLPIASNGAEQKDPSHRGVVNVLRPGARSPNGELVTDEKPFMVSGEVVSDEGLQKAIADKLKEDPNMRLYLRADRDVQFSLVRRGMAACAHAGVADVIFATYLQDLYLQEVKK